MASDRFCSTCGQPVGAPVGVAAAPRSSALPWLLGVGALAVIVIVACVIVIVSASRSTTTASVGAPEVFGSGSTTVPSTTARATVPTNPPTSPPATPPTTEPPTTQAPPTTPAADPVETLKNSVVTTQDGVRIQLVDGDGTAASPSDPSIRVTAYLSLAQRGTRWPAIGIVDLGAGAGATAQEIVVLDERGQVRQSGVFADRGSVSAVLEEGDRVRANYLERFPDDAMMAPGSIPAHATYDPVSGRTDLSPLAQPDAWCTADAGCMDTIGMGGFMSTEGYKVRSAPNRTAEVRYDAEGRSVFVAICFTRGENVDGDDRWLVSAVPHSFAWAKLFRLDTRFESGYLPDESPPAPGGPAPEC